MKVNLLDLRNDNIYLNYCYFLCDYTFNVEYFYILSDGPDIKLAGYLDTQFNIRSNT